MISYAAALQIIENNFSKIEPEIILFSDALDRVCAEKIIAPFSLPRFHNSSMDGFAILSVNSHGATNVNPKKFVVTNSIAAGDHNTSKTCSAEAVQATCTLARSAYTSAAPTKDQQVFEILCCEIMTGAPLPLEYDCVVPIEDVKIFPENNSKSFFIEIFREIKNSENIRFKGNDYLEGDILIGENEIVTNEKMMVLSSFGIEYIKVKKKIKIAIFSTGKEIVSHDSKNLAQNQIFNSTSLYLKSVLSRFPVDLTVFNNIPDDKNLFLATLNKIIEKEYHLIISTGAVSKGKWDIIPECLLEAGAEILFHRVKIKPGKPILFAQMNKDMFYFGLPGNPISTAVGFRFFISFFLRKCLGLEKEKPNRLKLDRGGEKISGMTFFLKSKVYIDNNSVVRGCILDGQESFKIKPLSESNGWIVLSDDIDKYEENDSADFLPV